MCFFNKISVVNSTTRKAINRFILRTHQFTFVPSLSSSFPCMSYTPTNPITPRCLSKYRTIISHSQTKLTKKIRKHKISFQFWLTARLFAYFGSHFSFSSILFGNVYMMSFYSSPSTTHLKFKSDSKNIIFNFLNLFLCILFFSDVSLFV